MKKIFFLITASALFAACGGEQSQDHKKKELAKLEKQQEEISKQIRQLRSELGIENVRVKNVLVKTLKDTTFVSSIDIQGNVKGDMDILVSPETPGTVTRILVLPGDPVSSGQLLAELDNKILVQTISEVQTQRDFAANIFQKQKNLWDQKIGTELQFLQAKNNLEALDKKLITLNEQLDMTRIKSPISGTVDAVHVKVGQLVAPGVPAFGIVDIANLKVTAEVPEVYSNRFEKGSSVYIEFPHRKGMEPIRSKISHASRSINPLNRTFVAEVRLDDKDVKHLSPNMIAVVKLVERELDSVIVVPASIIQKDDLHGMHVYAAVNKNGKKVAELRKVEVGGIGGGKALIKSGLRSGDQVITVGYQGLADGDVISY